MKKPTIAHIKCHEEINSYAKHHIMLNGGIMEGISIEPVNANFQAFIQLLC